MNTDRRDVRFRLIAERDGCKCPPQVVRCFHFGEDGPILTLVLIKDSPANQAVLCTDYTGGMLECWPDGWHTHGGPEVRHQYIAESTPEILNEAFERTVEELRSTLR